MTGLEHSKEREERPGVHSRVLPVSSSALCSPKRAEMRFEGRRGEVTAALPAESREPRTPGHRSHAAAPEPVGSRFGFYSRSPEAGLAGDEKT